MIFSVVICTYQRAELLKIALQTLCKQAFDKSFYEVIVVDNNSTDHTKSVAENFVKEHSNIRYFLETNQGLSYARNRGWQEAKGTYVAYIDDECKVPSQWLSVAQNIIRELTPGVLGGPFFGYHNQPIPLWWKELYGEFTYTEMASPLAEHEHLSGGNFIVRRSLLEELGGFNVSLGMVGNKLAFGEESEFQQRVRQQKPNELIYYDPALFLYHLVRPEKYSLCRLIASRFSGGRYSYFVFNQNTDANRYYSRFKLAGQAARIIMNCCSGIIVNIVRRDRSEYPYLQNYIYEVTGEYVHKIGTIYEQFRIHRHA